MVLVIDLILAINTLLKMDPNAVYGFMQLKTKPIPLKWIVSSEILI